MTRRTFLQSTALGLGAAALAPGLSLVGSATGQERKLGVALVGLGSYATYQLAPALQRTQHCRLAGIVTGTPSKAETWSKRYDIAPEHIYSYETFDRIADDDAIDIVYVVTPNGLHAEHTIQAAKAGKHVICEKPMANTVAEAEAMIEACRAADRRLFIGYRLHFDPFHQEVMRLGREKVFGPVKIVEASFGFRIGDPSQWRLNRALAGGGPLMDLGVYAVQGARYVLGEEPIAVIGRTFVTDPDKFREVEETVVWTLEFPSGAVAQSTSTYNAPINRLYAMAPNGWFELEPAYNYSGIQGHTSEGPLRFDPVNQQAAQMDAMAQAILTGAPSSASGEEGLRDMKILEAIYRSAASGGERIELSL